MKRTTIFIDEGLESEIKILAARRKEPVAALVREALEGYLNREKDAKRTLSFVAAGRSGHKDTAERHEELLWRERKTRR
jgi:predicted transcriptional regulator